MDKLVKCETKDCENEGIELLIIDCQDRVVCGCCNVDITNITDLKPEPKAKK
jgi:ferredoxin